MRGLISSSSRAAQKGPGQGGPTWATRTEHSRAHSASSPVFALMARKKKVCKEILPFIPLFQKQAGALSSKQSARRGGERRGSGVGTL